MTDARDTLIELFGDEFGAPVNQAIYVADKVMLALAHSPAPDTAIWECLKRIRTSMALLQQNSEGCALTHHGGAETRVSPRWLVDTKRDLEVLTDMLAYTPKPPRWWRCGAVERLRGVEGIGAGFNRGTDCWHLYTMPDTKPFPVTVGPGFDRGLLDWVIGALRDALAPPAPVVEGDRKLLDEA